MKTWTIKLNAHNKNNQPYQHIVTAPLALIRDPRNKLHDIIKATPGTQITTNAHPQTTTPLTITKNKPQQLHLRTNRQRLELHLSTSGSPFRKGGEE